MLNYWHCLLNPPPPPAFRPKYSVFLRNSRSLIPNMILVCTTKPLVSEIFAFYHLLENALRRPGCRGHVHLTLYIAIEGYEGF